MMENGLTGMDAMLQQAQSVLDQVAGQAATTKWREAPLEGPADIEQATSELANRLMRLALARNLDTADKCWQALEAVFRSLPRNCLHGPPHWLALPFALPLAMSNLTIQESLRTIGTLPAVRPQL
jgi:hypothetical protein